MKKRPLRGKKKPSETILARALVVGFLRFDSTDRRELKVRILKMEGPVNLSAREAAMGAIIVFESWVDKESRAEGGPLALVVGGGA